MATAEVKRVCSRYPRGLKILCSMRACGFESRLRHQLERLRPRLYKPRPYAFCHGFATERKMAIQKAS